jgi:DNA-binding MarR family transcriptional regulator
MGTSSFDILDQQDNLGSKILVSLERVSKAFQSLLWDIAKREGLSPIQTNPFIGYHKKELATIYQLAKEFNLTKPTLSYAVKTLEGKKLLNKYFNFKIDVHLTLPLPSKVG